MTASALLRWLLLVTIAGCGRVSFDPVQDAATSTLDVRGLRLWDGRFDVRCRGGQVDVTGLPDGRRAEVT